MDFDKGHLFDEASPVEARKPGGPLYRSKQFLIDATGRLISKSGYDLTLETDQELRLRVDLIHNETSRGPERRVAVYTDRDKNAQVCRVNLSGEIFWMPKSSWDAKSLDGLILSRKIQRQLKRE